MDSLNPTLAVALRQRFQELHALADEGLAALGPDERVVVNIAALQQVNEKLRQLAALILALQDQAER